MIYIAQVRCLYMYFNFHFRLSLNKLTYMWRCPCPIFFILAVLCQVSVLESMLHMC